MGKELAIKLLEHEKEVQAQFVSRQQAIEVVHKYFADAIDKTPHEIDEDGYDVYTDMKTVNELLKHNKHISKAIKALSPVTPKPVCEDAISRQAVRSVILENYRKLGLTDSAMTELSDEVKSLPPATPTERTGVWVKVTGYVTPGGDPVWECSECGKGRHVYGVEASSYQRDVSDQQWVTCPNCGARMVGDNDER